jgi:hypothetical protein
VNDAKSAAIQFAFAVLPYLAVPWLLAVLFGDSFWLIFGGLLAVRLFFVLIELLGSVVAWRSYGKKRAIQHWLTMFQANKTKREYAFDITYNEQKIMTKSLLISSVPPTTRKRCCCYSRTSAS